jgi:hypothetical protein
MKIIVTIFILILVTTLFSTNSQCQIILLPTSFQLDQNTPDPFDTTGTNIGFSLPKNSVVSLWIEDAQGNVVDSLISQVNHQPGKYMAFWNSKSKDSSYITTGTYVCKINAASQNPIAVFDSSIQIHFQKITGIKNTNSNINPLYFKLSQNYPNPFNPSTIINFSLTKSDKVSLKIYDLLGREVSTLVNEYKPAGNYSVNFKATNLSSGVYIYKLQAGEFVKNAKMILLK